VDTFFDETYTNIYYYKVKRRKKCVAKTTYVEVGRKQLRVMRRDETF